MKESWETELMAALPTNLPLYPLDSAPLFEYIDLLSKWNKKFNLVGAKTGTELLRNLICDSFYLAHFLETAIPHSPAPVWDLGSGAGIPAIPLRLLLNWGIFYLVEKREKRALFLANVKSRLKLHDLSIYRGSAESFLKENSANLPACIISRAFMPWQKIAALCAPNLGRTGKLVIMANQSPPESLPMGWQLAETYSYFIKDKTRWFWTLSRTDQTNQARLPQSDFRTQ